MSTLNQQLRELAACSIEAGGLRPDALVVLVEQIELATMANEPSETSASAVSDEDVDAALNAAFDVEDSDDSYGFRSLLKRSIRAALEADRKRRAAQQVIGEPVAWMHPKSLARLMKAQGNGDEDASGYAYAYAFPGSKEDVALVTAHLATRAAHHAAQAVPNGASRIAAERMRQIEKGFTPELDRRRPRSTVSSDHDASRALLLAAMTYLSFASARPAVREELRMDGAPDTWPWGRIHWRPGPDDSKASRIRELEKAGALIAAEIDRLLAAAPTGEDE